MTDKRQPPQKINDAGQHVLAGMDLQKRGQLDAARDHYRAALRLDRNHPDALHMLGIVTHMKGDTRRAIEFVNKALAARPGFPPALANLVKFYVAAAQYDRALETARAALEIDPEMHEVLMPMAGAYRGRGDVNAALEIYRTLIAAQSDNVTAQLNTGICLMDLSRVDEALGVFRAVLAKDPGNADAAYHLAVAFNTASRFGEALVLMETTLASDPDNVPALITAGDSLQSLGRMDEALELFGRAVSLAPDHPEAHFNLGLALLTTGDLKRGWDEYAWRMKTGAFKNFKPPLSAPIWQGEDIAGKSILLYPEQGIGDTINFIRYAAVARDSGARVLCLAPPPLSRMLQRFDGIDETVVPGADIQVPDYQISIMELPRVMGATYPSIPLSTGYLTAPESSFERGDGLCVGIVWQGNLVLKNDANRSVPLSLFEPLSRLEGVQLYSLQVGPGEEQIAMQDWAGRMVILGKDFKDYADTASVIDKLDLVIAVDTSVAHLAGALGKAVWLLLPANADWRWGRSGETTPWYESMRLFRQPELGQWDLVFADLGEELRHLAGTKGS